MVACRVGFGAGLGGMGGGACDLLDPLHLLHELGDGDTAILRDLREGPERGEAIERRPRVVKRVRGAQLLAEAVLQAGQLEHHPHLPTGDDTGTVGGRTQHHLSGAGNPLDLVGDGAGARGGDRDQVLLGVDDGLLRERWGCGGKKR